LKILYFNYLYDIRGASLGSAVKAIELFAALEKLGHEVKICWFKDQPVGSRSQTTSKKTREFLKRHLARFVHDPKLFFENFQFQKQEKRIVSEFQPDIIVSRLDLYLYSAVKTARKFDLPIIIEADSPPVYEAIEFQKQYWRLPAIPNKIERWVMHNADFVITQSNVLHDYFVKTHRLDSSKTAMITNGADIEKFFQSTKDEKLLNKYHLTNEPVIGFVGSMSVWHGIENLFSIIRKVLSNNPKVRFLLVGAGGGLEEEMRAFLRNENFEKQVILTGYVPYDKIPDYITLMNVVLAPYPNLPFFYYSPVKIFEYMAAGKTVITTPIGQIAEIITDGENGIFCSPDNLDQVVSSIDSLLHDSTECKRIGENARQTIVKNHTWMHKAVEWEAICNKVIKQG